MKRTTKLYAYAFVLAGSMLMLFSGCKKEDENKISTLTTAEVTEITQTSALSGGNITDDGGAPVTARGVCWSTNQNPTIDDNKTEDGDGIGNFTSTISDLVPGTTYYVRAYATNSGGTGYGNAVSFITLEGVTDIDGNVYSTVVIGDQEWFVENLKTTRYNNGTAISNVTNNGSWVSSGTPAYCWYNNDIDNKPTYGALYNWFAVDNGNLCPTGWHVPTDAEWTALIEYAGGESVAGGKLKSTRTTPDAHPRWESPNAGATDEYGFSALPGGFRTSSDGSFDLMGQYGLWWSSTEYGSANAWRVFMYYDFENIFRHYELKTVGFSVRCIKD